GECELIDGKHGGLTVSIGARVASQAGPSAVLVSQTVKDLTAGSGFTFEDAGEHELKGIPDRWRLYRVVGWWGRTSRTRGTDPSRSGTRSWATVPATCFWSPGICRTSSTRGSTRRWRHFSLDWLKARV